MAETAEQLTESTPASGTVRYEYPLSERMRTYLRIESLYKELRFHIERESQWASRSAVANLLDISAILGRGDMRSDMLKELDRLLSLLRCRLSIPIALPRIGDSRWFASCVTHQVVAVR